MYIGGCMNSGNANAKFNPQFAIRPTKPWYVTFVIFFPRLFLIREK